MNPEEITPATPADPAASPEAPKVETPATPPAPSQTDKPKFSKRERLMHAQEKIEKQLEELDAEEDDNRPVTVGDLKKMQLDEVKKTAIELASSIEDEDERNEVIEMLESRIQPSKNPEQDLALARGAVNSLKNQRMLEEQARKASPAFVASAPGVPGKAIEGAFEPTPEEADMMRNFGLTEDDVRKARQREAAARQ